MDVLVVGCGPAGSSTAKVVAEAGYDCVVIDEHPEIGLPIQCAGGISHSMLDLINIKETANFIKGEIFGSKILFYDEVYAIPSWTGFCIDRHGFDKFLSRKAEKAGAKIFTSTKAIKVSKESMGYTVMLESDKVKEIKTKILVGADGSFSFIGKATGIRKPLHSKEFVYCLQHDVDSEIVPEKEWYFIFNEELVDGYAWIFPKNNQANVGVSSSNPTNIHRALRNLIREYPQIKSTFGKYLNTDILKDVYGYPICGPKPIDEIVGDGVILVGDAAGITNPITGEGIEPAINSGIAAGEIIVNALKKNDLSKKFLSQYDQRWRNRIMHDLKLGDYLNESTQLRDQFYKAFNERKVPKDNRMKLIAQITGE